MSEAYTAAVGYSFIKGSNHFLTIGFNSLYWTLSSLQDCHIFGGFSSSWGATPICYWIN